MMDALLLPIDAGDARSGRPMSALGAHDCLWPVNNAAVGHQHLFCGSRKEKNKPYCGKHCRVAYHPRATQLRLPKLDNNILFVSRGDR